MKKICFISLYSYSLFNKSTNFKFGGSEVRAVNFGKKLSKNENNEITFIVFNHKQNKKESFGNIKIYAHSFYKTDSLWHRISHNLSQYLKLSWRFPFIKIKMINFRFFLKLPVFIFFIALRMLVNYPKKIYYYFSKKTIYINKYQIVPAKTKIYEEIDADIYCIIGVSNLSAEIAAFCKKFNKKFVLIAGCDEDFSDNYYKDSKITNNYGSFGALCYYTIEQADAIITQTHIQADFLDKRFNKNATIIQNPIDLKNSKIKLKKENYVLWVGKSDNIKNPFTVIDLAAKFPDIKFIMVMNLSNHEIYNNIQKNKTKNVEIIKSVPFDEIEILFAKACIFLNTSIFEGFPNTFLQAAKYGVPILSYIVNPDNFITKYNCGKVAENNFNNLQKYFKELWTGKKLYNKLSKNVYSYVRKYHDIDKKVKQLANIFIKL